jgi:hypothetical protein
MLPELYSKESPQTEGRMGPTVMVDTAAITKVPIPARNKISTA